MSATQATQGYGCMGLSAFYSSAKDVTPEKAKAIIHHVVGKGVTMLNTATFYGPLNEPGFGANLRLLRGALDGIPRSQVHLMVKIGMDTRCPVEKTGSSWVMRGSPASLMADVDYALEQLGVEYIDTIVLCRVPKDVSIEEAVGGMVEVVKSGKARNIGVSEASAATIRRAHAVHPLYCIEQEWSLWARDIEAEIVPACRELGIKIIAYSPLGRGFLTGAIRGRDDALLEGVDFRKMLPKFAEENIAANLALVDAAQTIALRRNITPGQLALAWLHAQGPDVVPIPGTSSCTHFDENLAATGVLLSAAEMAEIDEIFKPSASPGQRYAGNHNTFHEN
mmetsp:Transcript_33986/g.74854  ORF Transcript_33986/g.74854 Transcript_33986/m.74854 type:complete len:337 (+) Transcript_33986:79-1089(+)|eukprot:CAMPEP_0173189694 /NCGR_PEP_ID=MMETSP1141-20130122/11939_1 /TAXON_ID=483371 /ORGANISM="non described non described, Strain CCMP2298" /LENGTH=336 /DNA_ID=CAMNT_0014113735 /DNA_START=79 /DNA_END=1089 /DNA_ORIENTATION=-